MSSGGLVPSEAWAAASAGAAPSASARSTPLARSGVDPMWTSATRSPCTAAPTIAQSMARLVNFWNDHPAWAGLGTRISVSSSSGSSAVEQALAGGAAPADAAAHAAEGTSPPEDINADREYREHLARVLVARGLAEARSRA